MLAKQQKWQQHHKKLRLEQAKRDQQPGQPVAALRQSEQDAAMEQQAKTCVLAGTQRIVDRRG